MFFGYFLVFFLDFLAEVSALQTVSTPNFDRITELITEWAPTIWLAPKEKFFPGSVKEFLDNVQPIIPGSTPEDVLLPIGSDSLKYHLITKEDLASLQENRSSFLYGKNPSLHKIPVYVVVTQCTPNLSFRVTDADSLGHTINIIRGQADPDPYFYAAFWFFYPYNEGKEVCFIGNVPTPMILGSCIGKKKLIGNHVGDWEHMTMSFSGKPYPERLYATVHDAGVYYKYDTKSRHFKYERQVTLKGIMQKPKFPPVTKLNKGRPTLFSAYGSHGLWTAPGDHYYVRMPRLIDSNGYGTIWETWKSLKIYFFGTSQLPSWIGYEGRWGNPRKNCFLWKKLGICELSDGPRGIFNRAQDFTCVD